MQKHIFYRPTSSKPPPLTCIDVDSLCKYVACGTADSRIIIISARTGRPMRSLVGHEDVISAIRFVRDNRELISISWDGSIRKWSIGRSTHGTGLIAHTASAKSLALSHSSNIAAVGFQDGAIIIFSTKTMKILNHFTAHSRDVSAIEFMEDDRSLLSASWDGSCKLWNLATFECTILRSSGERIHSMLCLNKTQQVLLGLHSGNIVEIPLSSSPTTRTHDGHSDAISVLTNIMTHGKIVSGGWDRYLRFWDMSSIMPIDVQKTVSGITDLCVCAKSESLFVSDFSGTITMWVL